MPVIQTQNWLYQFVSSCEERSGKGATYLQREIICDPLMQHFPNISQEALQYELVSQGLFEAKEWRNIKSIVKEMEAQHIWQVVKQEYKFLRGLWKGPKASIYIFPITKANVETNKQVPIKNGVAYKKAIFLFLSTKLSTQEIKAIVAHEYNHVCRLNHLDLSPDKIPLKDSLIIEGFGEYAVKELYGEKWLSPWTNLYSFEDASNMWKNLFIPSLNIRGVKKHYHFLFGKAGTPFPKWIGYHIGFQIVDSFQRKHGPFPNNELYKKSSDEIIAGSDYPIKIDDI